MCRNGVLCPSCILGGQTDTRFLIDPANLLYKKVLVLFGTTGHCPHTRVASEIRMSLRVLLSVWFAIAFVNSHFEPKSDFHEKFD